MPLPPALTLLTPVLALVAGCSLVPSALGAPATPQPAATASSNLDAKTLLERNPLYSAPRVTGTRCAGNPVSRGRRSSMEQFLTGVADCLDRIWEQAFESVKRPFAPPKRTWLVKPGATKCGRFPTDAGGLYCPEEPTLYVLIRREDLDPREAVHLATTLAHEYGHHVQQQAGILTHAEKQTDDGWSRRVELQAECLGGVSLRALREPLKIGARWEEIRQGAKSVDGDATWRRTHGKGVNVVRWLERGYRSGKPGTCNTWTAPAAQVS